VRRVSRTVKRSVNRSSCTCKRKVCSRVVVCGVACTFSVLEGLPKIGNLSCAFSTPEVLEFQFSRYTN
jgi:hypothetical protein